MKNSLFRISLLLFLMLSLNLPGAAQGRPLPGGGLSRGSGLSPLEERMVPYVSTYYVKPLVLTAENVVFEFYITDWEQSEYRLGDDSKRFTVEVECGLLKEKKFKKIVHKNVKPGNLRLPLGKFTVPGEYLISLQATDPQGRKSHVVYHEFLVRSPAQASIPAQAVYRMTADDLQRYKISNRGNYGKFEFIETDGINGNAGLAGMVQDRERYVKPEKNGYLVIATAKKGIPDMLGSQNARIIYGAEYDKLKVEAEAVQTMKGLNALLADCAKKGFRKMVMLPGTYRISHTGTISIPSGFTLDMNGAVLKMNQFAGHGAVMMQILDAYDSHVLNGIVEGDYFEHDYAQSENNSEWVCGIDISGASKYCSYEDMEIRYITGYGVMNGFKGLHAGPVGTGAFMNGRVSASGKVEAAEGLATSERIDVSAFLSYGYLTVSRYLGYQGRSTGSWNYVAHFYSPSEKYLGAVEGYQYRLLRIPERAKYMRITVVADKALEVTDLSVQAFKIPWNCSFKNLKIVLCRCVGMAQSAMRNFLVENCEFTRCGETGAFCAYDAEDGWDMMQDITIRGNKFHHNWRNDFLTCAGHNFIVENNEGRIHIWDRTSSYVIRNNRFSDAYFGSGDRLRTQLSRIENNTFSGPVRLGGESRSWTLVMHGPLNAPSIQCGTGGMLADVELKDMKLGRINAINSTLENVDLAFAGSTFINSTLKNVRGHSNGALTIRACDLENISSSIFQPSDIVIENSSLKNVQFNYAYWTKPGKFTISRSSVSNSNQSFLRTPSYSIGEFLFQGCHFDTGTSPLLEIYDLRAQDTDKDSGTLTFQKNLLKSGGSALISVDKGENKKNLNFRFSGNQLPAGMELFSREALPSAWKVFLQKKAAQR